MLIHTDALRQHDELVLELLPLAALNVEGGDMAMVCAEVRNDEKFLKEMPHERPIIQGRGCALGTHGDGAHRLRGAKI